VKSEYFCKGDWTTQITLESLGKSSSDGIGYPVDDAISPEHAGALGRVPINCEDGVYNLRITVTPISRPVVKKQSNFFWQLWLPIFLICRFQLPCSNRARFFG
jgi:hypothetical protein